MITALKLFIHERIVECGKYHRDFAAGLGAAGADIIELDHPHEAHCAIEVRAAVSVGKWRVVHGLPARPKYQYDGLGYVLPGYSFRV